MESFEGGIPVQWSTTTPSAVSRQTAVGMVHSGNSAVKLTGDANLRQDITEIEEGGFYEFSFFALAEGSQGSLEASVIFKTEDSEEIGAIMAVRLADLPRGTGNYVYYRIVTIAAPVGVTKARISFEVSASEGQSINIDDVSFLLR